MSHVLDELEASLMTNLAIQSEVERLASILRKLSDDRFVSLSIAMRRESARRIAPVSRPVGIGNR